MLPPLCTCCLSLTSYTRHYALEVCLCRSSPRYGHSILTKVYLGSSQILIITSHVYIWEFPRANTEKWNSWVIVCVPFSFWELLLNCPPKQVTVLLYSYIVHIKEPITPNSLKTGNTKLPANFRVENGISLFGFPFS